MLSIQSLRESVLNPRVRRERRMQSNMRIALRLFLLEHCGQPHTLDKIHSSLPQFDPTDMALCLGRMVARNQLQYWLEVRNPEDASVLFKAQELHEIPAKVTDPKTGREWPVVMDNVVLQYCLA